MITSNLGLLLLAIYLIIIGVSGLTPLGIPGIVLSILALAAGVLLLLGK
jgi:hypothetical protein